MSDSYTTNRAYRLQTTGGDINTWGVNLNTIFSQIDSNISATLSLNVGGSSNVTLSASQAANMIHNLSGTLTGNILYTFPATGGFWFIRNGTSGAYTITAKVSGGSGAISIPQGGYIAIYIDASVPNIYQASPQNIFFGGTSAGTATVQTLTTSTGNFTLTAGNIVVFIAGFSSGAGMTLAVDGTTAKTVQFAGSAIASGNYSSGNALIAYYDGTNFQLIGGATANLSAYALLNSPTFTGTPSLPTGTTGVTQAASDSSTKLATTAFAKMAPTIQRFTSGSGTYTTPTGVAWIRVSQCGGGGGGGGATGSGGAGGNTTFASWVASGGAGGTGAASPASGGVGGYGGASGSGSVIVRIIGQEGGTGYRSGAGSDLQYTATGGSCHIGAGGAYHGPNNTGSAGALYGGGGAGGLQNSGACGGGGGGGEYVQFIITSPSATYSYSVGTAGTAGTGSPAGAVGAAGIIIVEEYYIG